MAKKEILPFTHLSFHPKGRRARRFRGQLLKKATDYNLVLPDRQFFVQLVKFVPGRGPKDWVAFHKSMNRQRRGMDIHEIATFLTWGRYDMVVIWDAPDLETYNKFLASWVNPGGNSPVTSETQVVASALAHTH